LDSALEEAFGRGLLTGELPAEVRSWNKDIAEVREADWIGSEAIPDEYGSPEVGTFSIQPSGTAISATYVAVFDDRVVCRSPCVYDPKSKIVTDIGTADNTDEAENADARTDEYVYLPDGTELREDDGVVFDY
jgi:hypothetical protein